MKKLIIFTLGLIFVLGNVFAATKLEDEGTTKGYINALDCVGAGVACTASGWKGTMAVDVSVGNAPDDADYITLSTDSDLDNERVLTGTANQVAVTDNGAGSTVVLSTPQDIHTGATPTFVDLILSNFSGGNETIDEILDDTLHADVLDEITVTDEGGINISWTVGEIWDASGLAVVDTDLAGSTGCSDDNINFLYWDQSGGGTALTLSTTEPNKTLDVLVATVNCASGDIHEINQKPIYSQEIPALIGAFRDIFPSIVTSGLIVSEHSGGEAFDVDMTGGTYYVAAYGEETLTSKDSSIGNDLLTRWYQDGASSWTAVVDQSEIDETQYNTGNALTGVTANKFYRSMFFVTDDGINWVYPDIPYDTIAQAIAGSNPVLPAGLTDHPRSTIVILRGDDAAFPTAGGSRWIDVRPILGGSVSGDFSDHGNLAGLGDDDHTQYTLHSLADAANDFLVASGNDAFVKKTLAETGAILEADISHDNLVDFVAAEHVDWAGASAGTIHTDNYIENATHTGEVTGSGELTIADSVSVETWTLGGGTSFDDDGITNVADIALDTISSDGASIVLGQGDENTYTQTGGVGHVFTLGADAADDFIIDTTGFVYEGDNNRVGIGTGTPEGTLHIEGSSFPVVRLKRTTTGTAFALSAFDLVCKTTNDAEDGFGANLMYSIQDDGLAAPQIIGYMGFGRDGVDGKGKFHLYPYQETGVSASKSMCMNADGYMGIGTQSPEGTLHLEAAATPALIIDDTGANEYRLVVDGTRFYIRNQTGSATVMNIVDDHTGFGVTDPDTQLEVLNAGTQVKLSYDATNYFTFATQTDGDLTLDSNKASYVLDLGDGVLTTTGDITGGGIHVTGDTAASDNAALGYTATEGLILTGQGSTNDITFKNDADGTFMHLLTGTTELVFDAFPITPSAAPDADYEVANKKYVDDNAGGAGDVTAAANIDANAIVIGDDGAKGVKKAITTISDTGDMVVGGTTPELTVGDAGAEDAQVTFDGNEQDYHLGLDDTDNSLKIGLGSALGTTTHMSFDSTGSVLKPLQPSCLVRMASAQANIADADTIIFDTEVYDLNADYNSGTYTFTCPVTGRYLVCANVVADNVDDAATETGISLRTSNGNYFAVHDNTIFDSDGLMTYAIPIVVDADAADTIYVRWAQQGGTAQADVDKDFSSLSITLLH